MKDYIYGTEDGKVSIRIADMTTPMIKDLLASDLYVVPGTETVGVNVEKIKDRLRIELVARGLP